MQFNNLNFKLRYDAGQQTKELKPGKRKKLLEKKLRKESKEREERGLEICKESKEREERGLEICKVCKFFINHQKSINIKKSRVLILKP
jgi:hypothetical protein